MQNQAENQTVINSNNAAASVVQNDTLASIAVSASDRINVAPANDAITTYVPTHKRIQQLVAEREVWEQGAFRTSNEQLYALLAKCYALYVELCLETDAAKALRVGLNDFIDKRALRFTKGTHTLTKIVKCVFGVDRRRVSTYSLVLREALTQKLKADEVAAFIASNGGVEEIRRSKSKTAKTPKQKAELGKRAVCGNQLAVISGEKISEGLDPAKVGEDFVAIVTQQADGSFIVRKLVYSQSVLNAALACAYSASNADGKKDAANNEAANDAKALDDLIAQAA